MVEIEGTPSGLQVGVVVPAMGAPTGDGGRLSLVDTARLVEEVGLDSAWVGDHLATGAPSLDSAVAVATVAAVTDRLRVGTGVFVPGLRPLAWAAKQIASLRHLAGDRLVLGVGAGGGPEQWAAAGVPFDRRGARLDAALRLLPDLLAGRPTVLPDEPGRPTVELAPAVSMPPVWVGNASPAAIRRAATWGDGWFPSLIHSDDVAAGAERLAALAADAGRPTPTIAVGAVAALGAGPDIPTRASLAASIAASYQRPLAEVLPIPLTGTPDDVAAALGAYGDAGVAHVVVGLAGPDWPGQLPQLREARDLVLARRR
jgi:alkanesulfonate monooxygenase SsuD/methylene tetrahydromethanopterin reductase-like flavin-dependent oxidoreductase (luciferase family)